MTVIVFCVIYYAHAYIIVNTCCVHVLLKAYHHRHRHRRPLLPMIPAMCHDVPRQKYGVPLSASNAMEFLKYTVKLDV